MVKDRAPASRSAAVRSAAVRSVAVRESTASFKRVLAGLAMMILLVSIIVCLRMQSLVMLFDIRLDLHVHSSLVSFRFLGEFILIRDQGTALSSDAGIPREPRGAPGSPREPRGALH